MPLIRLAPFLFGLAFALPAQALDPGTDRPGSDYRDFDLDAPDALLCEQACRDDARCRAFSYVAPGHQGESARCWLKDEVPDAVADACCTSGVMARGIPLEAGIDRPGGDFHSFDIDDDPARCAAACEDEAQCRAFTFVRPGEQGESARCWLKDSVPDAQPSECCTSGVKPAS